MRYFGVDIGLKEAAGASLLQHLAWALCCLEKDQNGFNRAKGSGNGNGSYSRKEKIENLKRISAKVYQKSWQNWKIFGICP